MVILSSPSGVGKTTLTKKIQQKYQSFKISVSHTTRSPGLTKLMEWIIILFLIKNLRIDKRKKFYEYAKILKTIMEL